MKFRSFNRLKGRLIGHLIGIALLSFGSVTNGLANDAAKQAMKAATVFREIMATPEKGIPRKILGGSRCVAVFPNVLKGGFIVGGRYGRGVATCRTKLGWSAPVFLKLGGGSFGLQIGGQATDFILLFLNESGMESLLSSKFELGGEASAAAGPVGREAGAATDLKLGTQILTYSRSKGLFAGLELKGAVVSRDNGNMKAVYGRQVTAQEILDGARYTPDSLRIFPDTIARYTYAYRRR